MCNDLCSQYLTNIGNKYRSGILMISAFHGIFSFYFTPFHLLAVVPQRTSILTTSTPNFYLYLSLSFVKNIFVNTAQRKHHKGSRSAWPGHAQQSNSGCKSTLPEMHCSQWRVFWMSITNVMQHLNIGIRWLPARLGVTFFVVQLLMNEKA